MTPFRPGAGPPPLRTATTRLPPGDGAGPDYQPVDTLPAKARRVKGLWPFVRLLRLGLDDLLPGRSGGVGPGDDLERRLGLLDVGRLAGPGLERGFLQRAAVAERQ